MTNVALPKEGLRQGVFVSQIAVYLRRNGHAVCDGSFPVAQSSSIWNLILSRVHRDLHAGINDPTFCLEDQAEPAGGRYGRPSVNEDPKRL